jgi:SET domain-containing protein
MALIRRRSKIHNNGVYTDAAIRKGMRVVEYTGPRITVEEGDRRYEGQEITYLFGLQGGTHVIDGRGIARYINHSCDPNCETEEIEGRVWIYAMRDIKPGEELSYVYLLYDGEGEAPCSCGAKKCRGSLYSPRELRRRKRKQVTSKKSEARSKKRKSHEQK